MTRLSKEAVAKNIKEARNIKSKALGYRYTQVMLAKDSGYSQGYIGDIEAGRVYPSREAGMAVASIAGVSLDFIFGTETENLHCSKP